MVTLISFLHFLKVIFKIVHEIKTNYEFLKSKFISKFNLNMINIKVYEIKRFQNSLLIFEVYSEYLAGIF